MNDVQGNWHVPASMLERFARDPLAIDGTSAASVEQHLVSCGMCRDVVAERADTVVEAGSWRSIVDVIDRPARSWTEWMIEAIGAPPATARLMAATGQLRRSWALSITLAAFGAWYAGAASDSPGPLLAVAPLLPVLAVLAAFAPVSEPGGEAAVATPVHGGSLVVTRVLMTALPAIAVLMVVGGLGPGPVKAAWAWLLPGAALAATALAASTWMRASRAAMLLMVGWLVVVSAIALVDMGRPLIDSALFGPAGQAAAVLGGGAAAVLAWRRRELFSTLEVSW